MKQIIFNQDYFLRHDVKRTFIINKSTYYNSSYGWASIIHPIHAMIFSFFSHGEYFDTVLSRLSEFLELSLIDTEKLITPFIDNNEDVYVELENVKFMIPKNVLISTDKNVTNDDVYNPEDFICSEYDFKTRRYIKAPLNITFMPNNKCVTDCIYCYADKMHSVEFYLPFPRIIEILDEAKDLGILNFDVVGGEIFTYPRWKELLNEIHLRGFKKTVISTKVPISLSEIQYLKTVGVNKVQISLDSLIHDEMTAILGVNDDYAEKIKGTILNLNAENVEIQIATILTKYNTSRESIDSIFDFIKDINIHDWNIAPGFESIYKPQQSFRSNKETLYSLFEYIESLKVLSSLNISIDKTFIEREYGDVEGGSQNFEGATCSALCSHIFVLPDGKVTMCEQLYWNPNFIIGDLTKQSITEVWNSDRAKWFLDLKREDLQKSNPCCTCSIFNECYNNMNRCWAEVIKAYGHENWDFPDPRCQLAPPMINNLLF